MSSDPTAFGFHVDPLTHKMEGTAIHGDTPFSMPLISQIDDSLFMGGCIGGLRLPIEIDHVVSLYPWEQYVPARDLVSFLTVKMFDSEDQSVAPVIPIAEWINGCRKTGPTFVHCQAGLNRSGLVVAVALVLEGRTPREAIDFLRERRSPAVLCNQAFEAAVLGLEVIA